MPTTVDALIVTLGLDPTNLSAGKKEAVKDLMDLKDQASKAHKEMGKGAKDAGEAMEFLKDQILGVGAAVLAGQGIKEFASHVQEVNIQIGRTGTISNTSAKDVAKFRDMLTLTGGKAESADKALAGMAQNLDKLAFAPQTMQGFIGALAELQRFAPDVDLAWEHNGKLDKPLEFMERIGKALAEMKAKGNMPGAIRLGETLGMDGDTVIMFARATEEMKKLNEEVGKNVAVSQKDVDVATKLGDSWEQTKLAAEHLGTVLETKLGSAGAIAALEGWTAYEQFLQRRFSNLSETLKLTFHPFTDEEKRDAMSFVRASNETAKDVSGIYDKMGHDIEHGWSAMLSGMLKTLREWVYDIENAMPEWLRKKLGINSTPQQIAAGGIGAGIGGSVGNAVSRPPPIPALPTGERRRQMEEDIQFYMGKGLDREHATSMVMQQEAESGGRADLPGDGGAAIGTNQWHPDRQQDFADHYGHRMDDPSIPYAQRRREQLDFAYWELMFGKKRAVGQQFLAAKGYDEQSAVLTGGYEVTANIPRDTAIRAGLAKAYDTMPPGGNPNMPLQMQAPLQGAPDLAAKGGAATPPASGGDTTVTIGDINIHTPTTDPAAHGQAITDVLNDRFAHTMQANGNN